MPRQSLAFNAGSHNQQLNSILACTQRIRSSCDTVAETNRTIEHYAGDSPRLSTVMNNKRHFGLVSESDVRQARRYVAAEIAPLLRELIVRAEDALSKEERYARTLRTQATQELADLEVRSYPQTKSSVPNTSPFADNDTCSPTTLKEQQELLDKLQDERKRLTEKVTQLEQKTQNHSPQASSMEQ
ncbi:hypothetical protein MYAM1_001141 [Malassezia yamatoensis]|uniref:DASH complex subunit SPC19 n=1 Tax=Malassezia yamatoensis TaxID=253288 RepID=A0AAJ6CG43_9BASI|nr:hypothetical protein MYAM1_001141 [Malassezia yamatoensis]